MDRQTIITKKQITKKEYNKFLKKGLLNTKNLKEFGYNHKTKTTTVVYAWCDTTYMASGYIYHDYTRVIEEHKDNRKTVKYFAVVESY
jgi:rhamnogalacturonyl hydrolase YesR